MHLDFHTHQLKRDAIVNIDPTEVGDDWHPQEGYTYSVGIHPWNTATYTAADIERLERLAALPEVVAIGEAGLDTVHQPAAPVEEQVRLLEHHIALSERAEKPLILHVVKRWDEIIALRKRIKPRQLWVIHGFRGKPQLARQLLAAGFGLSYGLKYNPEAYEITPPERRFRETDEDGGLKATSVK